MVNNDASDSPVKFSTLYMQSLQRNFSFLPRDAYA